MPWELKYRRYSLEFRAPVRTAHGTWARREGAIVRLTDESGIAAYGEAAPVPEFSSEKLEDDEAALLRLGNTVDESSLASIPLRLACLRNAIAAARRPVEREAGGKPEFLPVAALLPAGRAALEVVRAKLEAGFRVFKWKVGVGDAGDEMGILDDLCAALPGGALLRLDANGAWDRRLAERWLNLCAVRPIEFVEQPVARDAKGADDLLRGLASDFPVPLALDESLAGDEDVARWLDGGWPGIFVVKPSLLGDVAGALASLQKAQAQVVFSSALETPVGAGAALRFAFQYARKANRTDPPDPTDRSDHPPKKRAIGFGVWPLFSDSRFNVAGADGPFLYREDVAGIDAEAIWNAAT